MDGSRVTLLRELLAGTGWVESTAEFAGGLHAAVTRRSARPGGLLLVGGEAEEPWHLAAHLTDEAGWCGVPELAPTLVRHRVPDGAPGHLAVPLRRLEEARRNETVFVVGGGGLGEGVLQRVSDARRTGATVLALEDGDPELRALAHEALAAPGGDDPVTLDVLQHLVSSAAGTARRGGARALLRRWFPPAGSAADLRW
ncbi:hypothetical protein [Phaeacidiphilus oryzae]|uniref:hypothetical protein n=1 Tax=Phaeacidiphilus oryzae TaxID=348818 RepID=UPI000ACB524F|nr:hypothetical protein [Phaeacidiphilus oryzae]